MSKAVITWNLNDFYENQDFKRSMKSKDMAMLLWELKHNSDTEITELINKLFEQYNVDIDDLID